MPFEKLKTEEEKTQEIAEARDFFKAAQDEEGNFFAYLVTDSLAPREDLESYADLRKECADALDKVVNLGGENCDSFLFDQRRLREDLCGNGARESAEALLMLLDPIERSAEAIRRIGTPTLKDMAEKASRPFLAEADLRERQTVEITGNAEADKKLKENESVKWYIEVLERRAAHARAVAEAIMKLAESPQREPNESAPEEKAPEE